MEPASPSTLAILSVLRDIPLGKVASYGQIAALAGNPRGARQVVRILHIFSEREKLPWHRVVDRNGHISLPAPGPGELQRRLLRREKIPVSRDGKIDLAEYGWRPGAAKRSPGAGRSSAGKTGTPGKPNKASE